LSVERFDASVQLKIQDVHLRFEDDFSNPEKPFSFGVCINNVSAQNPSKETVSVHIKGLNPSRRLSEPSKETVSVHIKGLMRFTWIS